MTHIRPGSARQDLPRTPCAETPHVMNRVARRMCVPCGVPDGDDVPGGLAEQCVEVVVKDGECLAGGAAPMRAGQRSPSTTAYRWRAAWSVSRWAGSTPSACAARSGPAYPRWNPLFPQAHGPITAGYPAHPQNGPAERAHDDHQAQDPGHRAERRTALERLPARHHRRRALLHPRRQGCPGRQRADEGAARTTPGGPGRWAAGKRRFQATRGTRRRCRQCQPGRRRRRPAGAGTDRSS